MVCLPRRLSNERFSMTRTTTFLMFSLSATTSPHLSALTAAAEGEDARDGAGPHSWTAGLMGRVGAAEGCWQLRVRETGPKETAITVRFIPLGW